MFYSWLFFISLGLHSMEIRYLTPPNLNPENVYQEVLCHRPAREGCPRVEREVINNKIVIHNYGHGSAGWSMGWGSAQAAVDLLQQSLDSAHDIVIIGGGVSGLMVGYLLIKAGYKPSAIIAREFDNLTSHKAGGFCCHQSKHPDSTIRDQINGWVAASFKTYKQIAQRQHPDFSCGARNIPGYFSDRTASDLEAYVSAGILHPAKDVIVDFKNGTQRQMVVYDDNVFIDTYDMIKNLQDYLKAHNVLFIQQEVSDLKSISSAIVFNCTGLGAKQLAQNDSAELMPVQGHLLLLKGQNPSDLQYTLEVEFGGYMTDTGFAAVDLCYILPKKLPGTPNDVIGVLGGTFIKGANSRTPHEKEFSKILQRASEFFGV